VAVRTKEWDETENSAIEWNISIWVLWVVDVQQQQQRAQSVRSKLQFITSLNSQILESIKKLFFK
jgi:hypothetical protein